MNKYVPLHCHSHYSILDGLPKPERMAKRIEELELDGCALTDHGVIAGSVQFVDKMKKANKQPILGCELYVCKDSPTVKNTDNRKLSHLPMLAKGDAGWKSLIRVTSEANKPEHFYHKPRLSLTEIAKYANGNLIGFSGHLGSDIANAIVTPDNKIYPNALADTTRLAQWLSKSLGKENFFLEVQLVDNVRLPIERKMAEIIREVSKKTGIPCIATPDAHYTTHEEAEDQRVLLCANLGTTMQKAQDPNFMMNGFFKSNHYHIPSYDEMIGYGHTEEELQNTLLVAEMCGSYNILQKPQLPTFPCPKGYNPDTWVKELCRKGWRDKIEGKVPARDYERYADRVKMELEVLQGAGLSSYFLIVRDILHFVLKRGWLPGPGRGSAAGCLVSYLLDITQIDPIKYDLLFERFYNAGRNTAERVSMPDVDIDIPSGAREEIIKYMGDQFGHDRVSQMITYQTLKGRSAITRVLSAHGDMKHDEIKQLTKHIVDEHKIADELQEMKKEGREPSILKWALEHKPKKFEEWCKIDKDDKLTGPLADRFAQAMRLEGTKSASSKHAAGIVIAPEPLNTMCPMVYDAKNQQTIAGMEMEDLEAIGLIKFDILGLSMLDKVAGVCNILETGQIKDG